MLFVCLGCHVGQVMFTSKVLLSHNVKVRRLDTERGGTMFETIDAMSFEKLYRMSLLSFLCQ